MNMKKRFTVLLGLATAILLAFNFKKKEGDLKLPSGFKAQVFAENVGNARHLAVTPQGNVYVKLSKLNGGGGIVLLQDRNKDCKAQKRISFGNYTGTGIAVEGNYLYASSDEEIFRKSLDSKGVATNTAQPQHIVTGLIKSKQH